MVFYNFSYYFWGRHCCCTETSIIGNDCFIFYKLHWPQLFYFRPCISRRQLRFIRHISLRMAVDLIRYLSLLPTTRSGNTRSLLAPMRPALLFEIKFRTNFWASIQQSLLNVYTSGSQSGRWSRNGRLGGDRRPSY